MSGFIRELQADETEYHFRFASFPHMPLHSEEIIQTIPAGERDRTIIVNCADDAGNCFVEIRQQSFGGQRVGWFTQASVSVAPESIALLRTGLGIASALPEMVNVKSQASVACHIDERRSVSTADRSPALRVWRAESA